MPNDERAVFEQKFERAIDEATQKLAEVKELIKATTKIPLPRPPGFVGLATVRAELVENKALNEAHCQ